MKHTSSELAFAVAFHVLKFKGLNFSSRRCLTSICHEISKSKDIKMHQEELRTIWKTCVEPDVGSFFHEVNKKTKSIHKPKPYLNTIGGVTFSGSDIAQMRQIYLNHNWSPLGHVAVAEFMNQYKRKNVSAYELYLHGRYCFDEFQAQIVKRRRDRLLKKLQDKNLPLPIYNAPSKIAEMRYHFPETLRPLTKIQRKEKLPFSPTLLPAQRPFKKTLFHFLVTELNWLTYTELIRVEFLVKIYGGKIIPHEDQFTENDMNKCIVLCFGNDKTIAERFCHEHKLPVYASALICQTLGKGRLDGDLLRQNIVNFQ